MQETGLWGTTVRGLEISRLEKQDLEIIILTVKREPKDLYEFIKIETSRGRIECAYYKAEGTDRGVILVTDISHWL